MASPRMRGRHLARQVALQWLYQCDAQGDDAPEGWAGVCAGAGLDEPGTALARALVDGTLAHRDALDALLGGVAENWSLSRMAVVDRNIVRMGAYEMLHHAETPPRVALTEAIELAKRFGGEKSAAFVNGVLDKLLARAEAARTAVPPAGTASPC